MNDSSSALDTDDIVLTEFQRDYEAAADRDAVVAEYRRRHPHLEPRFRARAEMLGLLADSRTEPPQPLPEWLGEFHVVRRIDHGGMGEIYLARHERLNRLVAVKVIRPERASPESLDRFRREQRALARLHQTHIVSIYAAGEQGDVHYFAMPHIEGAALNHVVAEAVALETGQPHGRTPPLSQLAQKLAAESDVTGAVSTIGPDMLPSPTPPPPVMPSRPLKLSPEYFRSVAEALADAAEALQHAHDAGIVHRDVKPGNLMVDKQGHCWVIDFGLAGTLPRGVDDDVLSATPVSATGIHGTPPYMAPEQWSGGKTDARTDVWGLGVTLYELLTLRRAFPGATTEETRTMILSQEPKRPGSLVVNVPRDLEAICLKALRKEAGSRYPSSHGVAEDLKRWLRGQPTIARPAGPFRRAWMWSRRNPGWAASFLLVLLTLLVTTGWVINVAQTESRMRKEEQEKNEAEARQRRFESLKQELEIIRLSSHTDGWSTRAWTKLIEAVKVRPDPSLREPATAALAGLDVVPEKRFEPANSSGVAFDETGTRLLFAGTNATRRGSAQTPRIWDRKTDTLTKFKGPVGPGAVTFDKDGKPLELVAGEGASLVLWSLEDNKEVGRFRFAAEAGADALAVNALEHPVLAVAGRGTVVAAAATVPKQDGVVGVWDTAANKQLVQFRANATGLALSPDGNLVAVGDRDGRVLVWSVRQAKLVAELPPASRFRIHCLAFSPDAGGSNGQRGKLAVGGSGSNLVIWDLERKLPVRCFGSAYDAYALAFSPDGTRLTSGGRAPCTTWDAATGRPLLQVDLIDFATGLAFSPDGSLLGTSNLSVFGPTPTLVWKWEDGRGIQTLFGLKARVAKLQFSPDGRHIAALAQDWQVGVWDRETGRRLHTHELSGGDDIPSDNAGLAFSHDGRRLAIATPEETRVWDVASGKEEHVWKLRPGLASTPMFDPTDKKLLLFRVESPSDFRDPAERASRAFVVRDLLAPNGAAKPLYTLKDFNRVVEDALAASDGTCFAVAGTGGPGGMDWRVAVFDGVTGKELWSDRTPDGKGNRLLVDPASAVLGVWDSRAGGTQLRGLKDNRFLGTLDAQLKSLGPKQLLVSRSRESPDIVAIRHTLHSVADGRDVPLVTFGSHGRPLHEIVQFDSAGTHLAWGNEDGTVTVCDIPEVQRRLAAVGLGW